MMATNKATLTGGIRRMDGSIGEFAAEYATRMQTDKPVYCLPDEVIQSLRQGRAHKPPILQPTQQLFESDLTSLCRDANAVGIWNEMPIQYSCLQEPPPPPTRSVMRSLGWSEQQMRTIEQFLARPSGIRQRLKGYAGWLVTDQLFLAARDRLEAAWQKLQPPERPSFPLQRSLRLQEKLPDMREVAAEVVQFQKEVEEFLDHWGLMCMVTWDLPEPQGPLIPAPISHDAPAMPKHGLHIVLPIHYPVLGNDDILLEIQRQQLDLAKECGLDTSIAGLPHHEAFGQMLRVEHIERTIRTRYAHRGRNSGLILAMEHGIADVLDIQVDHVKRLRKAISACKQGRREKVSWLRPRVGGLVH